jgi:hypothetical protein
MQRYLNAAVPLLEVLWKNLLEKNLRLTDSDGIQKMRVPPLPEDRAALKRDILAVAATIQDPEIRASYRHSLFEKNYLLFKKINGFNSRYSPNFSSSVSSGRANISKPKSTVGQKILLGILLKKPILLKDVGELLLRIDFADDFLSNVGMWLLGESFSRTDFSDETFCLTCSEYLARIDNGLLATHAPFLFALDVSNEEVLSRWVEIWFFTVGCKNSLKDLQAAGLAVKERFCEKNWQRMRAFVLDVRK